MTDKELMQQALEAMEYADACLKKQLTAKTKHEYAQDLLMTAGTALRDRLAQSNEFEPDWDAMAVMVEEQQRMAKRIAELEAQPEQQAEPVAWMDRDGDVYPMPENKKWSPPHVLLYTTPPQLHWVGLEAEDLAQIDSDEFWQTGNHMAIAMAVEEKLKERNNG